MFREVFLEFFVDRSNALLQRLRPEDLNALVQICLLRTRLTFVREHVREMWRVREIKLVLIPELSWSKNLV